MEPKPSAAVPCHISAEHDSRTVWCGNDFSLQIQTRRCCAFRANLDVGERSVTVESHWLLWCAKRGARFIHGADRSPPTAGANGTTDHNPNGRTTTPRNSLSSYLRLIHNFPGLGLWRSAFYFLGFYLVFSPLCRVDTASYVALCLSKGRQDRFIPLKLSEWL